MDLFIDFVIKHFWVIAAGILGPSFVGYIAFRNNRKNRAAQAAIRFRNTVLSELTGFYPISQHWERNEFNRIYESIPRIKSAAAEFKHFIVRKGAFEKAISEYDKYCRETTYDSITADAMYPGMRKKGEISKREQFKNMVDHLLSFANKK